MTLYRSQLSRAFGRPASRLTCLFQVVAALPLLVACPAVAAPAARHQAACQGVDQRLTSRRKAEYSRLVSAALGEKLRASDVEVLRFIGLGNWSAVYVSTPVTEDGMLFFQTVNGRKVFRDVWGGMVGPDDRSPVAAWARRLGAPERLARCFSVLVP